MAIVIVIGAVFLSIAALDKLRSLHFVHSRLWSCTTRTNTNRQTRFENLRRYYVNPKKVVGPMTDTDVVTFEFPPSDESAPGGDTIIEVPGGSSWRTGRYCHLQQRTCRHRSPLKGNWMINGAFRTDPNDDVPEEPGIWCRMAKAEDSVSFKELRKLRLYGSESARQLDHMLVSAVQDAELYFSLCSTPFWIRGLYLLTKTTSSRRVSGLVRWVLWIQLRTIFYQHDTLEYRGYCMILRPFFIFKQPEWVKQFERWSEFVIARCYRAWHYWLGTILFGMQSWYPEYELLESIQNK